MKTEQQIVEDSSLKLAVQLDDVRKQTQDLGAAIDLNTDTNVDVAKANETLVKAIDHETGAIKRSTEYLDTASYSKRNEIDVNEKYQKALERRTELENKLNAQQPIVPYSENDPERFKPKQKPASEEPADPAEPAFSGTLEDYLKANLGSLSDFKKQLREERKAKDRENNEGLGIAKIAKNAIQSTMSAGSNAISSLADTLLQGIPGAGMARAAVSGTTKFVKEKVIGGFESRKKTREQYEAKKSELTSKFEKVPQAAPAPESAPPTTDEKIRQDNENKRSDEERTDRKENGRERKENEKRHKSLLDALKNGQMMTLLSGLFSVLFTMFTGLLGSTRGILGSVLKLGPALIAMGAKLVSGMGAAIASSLKRIMPDFMKDKLPGAKTPKIDPKTGKPTADVDPKTGKPRTTTTTTTNTSTSSKETSKIERVKDGMKGAKAAGGEAVEAAGSKAASAGAKTVGKSAGKGAAVKVAAKVLGKTLLRFIPFVGTAMLAYDAYTIADELSGGKLTDSLMSLKDKAVSGATEALGMSAGAEPVSDEVDVHEKGVQQAEKQAEAKKTQEARATAAVQATAFNTTNNKTYSASGFAFGSDNMMQLQPYGVQSAR